MYVYNEPDTATAEIYVDQTGKPHFERDDAIKANVKHDLLIAIRADLAKTIVDDAEALNFAAQSMIRLIERNADMITDHFDNMDDKK